MRTRDRRQRPHLHTRRAEPTDHVSGVQPAHAVRHDIDALAICLLLDIPPQLRSAFFDGGGGGHRGGDDFDVVGGEGFGDAAPVVDAREEFPGHVEFVEAEEAVGEHDGVPGGLVGGAEGGVVVYDLATEFGKAGVGDVAVGVEGRKWCRFGMTAIAG